MTMPPPQDPPSSRSVAPVAGTGPSPLARALGATDDHGVDRQRVAGVVAAIVVALLILQNGGRAEIHFLFWEFRAPVWLMMTLTLVLGAGIWELIRRTRGRQERKADLHPASGKRRGTPSP